MLTDADIHQLILSVLYSGVGAIVFAVVFLLIVKLAPFSIQKEIEEDQNTSLGIIIGSVLIGLAMIISAAISQDQDCINHEESQLPPMCR